jgi:hypothetical protein
MHEVFDTPSPHPDELTGVSHSGESLGQFRIGEPETGSSQPFEQLSHYVAVVVTITGLERSDDGIGEALRGALQFPANQPVSVASCGESIVGLLAAVPAITRPSLQLAMNMRAPAPAGY